MRRFLVFCSAVALVTAACGGTTDSECEGIVDDLLDVLQQAIDQLVGQDFDLEANLFDPDLIQQFDELSQRSEDEGCVDSELNERFIEGVGELDAGDGNPAGAFLVLAIQQAAQEGAFDFNGEGL